MFNYLMEWQEGIDAHPEVPIYVSIYEEMKLVSHLLSGVRTDLVWYFCSTIVQHVF